MPGWRSSEGGPALELDSIGCVSILGIGSAHCSHSQQNTLFPQTLTHNISCTVLTSIVGSRCPAVACLWSDFMHCHTHCPHAQQTDAVLCHAHCSHAPWAVCVPQLLVLRVASCTDTLTVHMHNPLLSYTVAHSVHTRTVGGKCP